MMEIFEAFTAYLQGYPGLIALIGNDGVYPDIVPQERSKAAITYQAIGGDTHEDISGITCMESPIFEFSCYGSTNKEAYAVYKQLKSAFKASQSLQMGGLNIQLIDRLSDAVKDYESSTKRHSYKVDFQFYFN